MTIEKRFIKTSVELREKTDTTTDVISGSAILYDTPTYLWEDFIETIAQGALDGADLTDVLCTFNHEDDFILGRSINNEGNLKLMVVPTGLNYECESTDTTAFNDCIKNIRAKIVNGNSFEFVVAEDKYEFDVLQPNGKTATVRTILKFKKIRAVNPVINPAYEATEIDCMKRSVAEKRSKENVQPIEKVDADYFMQVRFKYNLVK